MKANARFPLGLLAAFAAIGPILPATTDATTWITPRDPLSRQESLEFSVSYSDLVVIGHVVAVRDSTVAVEGGFENQQWLFIRPKTWLKGSLPDTILPILPIRFGTPYSFAYSQAQRFLLRGERTVLAFLSGSARGLGLVSGPSSYSWGIASLSASTQDSIASEVAEVVRGQRPESLAARADLIVMGQALEGHLECAVDGKVVGCVRVAVDSVVAGPQSPDTVYVHSRFLGLQVGRCLMFFERKGARTYRLMSFRAGSPMVREGRVDGRPLGEVVRAIRESHASAHTASD